MTSPSRDPLASQALTRERLPLAQSILWFPSEPGQRDNSGRQSYPVFVHQAVLEAIQEHVASAPDASLMGFLTGELLVCPEIDVTYVVIDGVVASRLPIENDDPARLAHRLWGRLLQEVRRQDTRLMGWYRSRPVGDPIMSRADVVLHQSRFREAHQVGVVVRPNPRQSAGGVYRWVAGHAWGSLPIWFYELLPEQPRRGTGGKRTVLTWKNYRSNDLVLASSGCDDARLRPRGDEPPASGITEPRRLARLDPHGPEPTERPPARAIDVVSVARRPDANRDPGAPARDDDPGPQLRRPTQPAAARRPKARARPSSGPPRDRVPPDRGGVSEGPHRSTRIHSTSSRRVFGTVRRHRGLVAVITAAGSIAGWAATSSLDPRHPATVTLQLASSVRGSDAAAAPFGVSELARLVRSSAVLGPVVQAQRLYLVPRTAGDAAALAGFSARQRVWPGSYQLVPEPVQQRYRLVANGRAVERGTAGEPVGASLGFSWTPPRDAIARGLPVDFTVLAPAAAESRLARAMRVRLDRAANLVHVELRGRDAALTVETLTAIAHQVVSAAERLQRARQPRAGLASKARVLTGGARPGRPGSAYAPLLVGLSFVAGLGVTVVGVALLDRADSRIRYPEQITEGMGLGVVGVIPRAPPAAAKGGRRAAAVVEALRAIRLQVLGACGDTPLALTVASPGPGEGKSFVAVNLALSFAQAGCRVTLVDGNIRNGAQHVVLDVAGSPGLTDVLAGRVGLGAALRKTQHPGVVLLGSGRRAERGPELLLSPRLGELMERLRNRCDVIIVDSAPLAAGSDALVLGAATGSLLLVFRAGATDVRLASAKVGMLENLPIRVVGAVLNDVRFSDWHRDCAVGLPGYGLPAGDPGDWEPERWTPHLVGVS